MSSPDKYAQRGVSATKDDVHQAIKGLDKGLFPNAFCKILPDFSTGDDAYCSMLHADTAGTKTSLAYLYWRETGDLSVWQGIAQDAIVMNTDDMACVGCTDQFILSNTIGRNKVLIPGEVITEIIQYTNIFAKKMAKMGVNIHLAGGETADVGDIVRTIDVGFTAYARMKRADVIDERIQDGDVIIGFSSAGQSTYETAYNSGMGSNGLTSARHDVFNKIYKNKYPESCDPNIDASVQYTGKHTLTETISINGHDIPFGKLVLSPTRTYLPILNKVLRAVPRADIHGMIHCTGGGQSKVSKFIKGVRVVKDNLFTPPPLFQVIQAASGVPLREMYQVFNMGHRLEIYTKAQHAQQIIAIANSFDIDAQVVGYVEHAKKTEVVLKTKKEQIVYTA